MELFVDWQALGKNGTTLYIDIKTLLPHVTEKLCRNMLMSFWLRLGQ
ncbi:MAG: hypothetical protein H7240_08510 [Glaciimonas sp.]|nr:hypothetical protein [Glaciimonas sp.]